MPSGRWFKNQCEVCGEDYFGWKSTSRFCSKPCKGRGMGLDRARKEVTQEKDHRGQYIYLHRWIAKMYGKPDHCDICGKNKQPKMAAGKGRGKIKKRVGNFFQWSNRTGVYSKNHWHWWQLCRPCHIAYDRKFLGVLNVISWKK